MGQFRFQCMIAVHNIRWQYGSNLKLKLYVILICNSIVATIMVKKKINNCTVNKFNNYEFKGIRYQYVLSLSDI